MRSLLQAELILTPASRTQRAAGPDTMVLSKNVEGALFMASAMAAFAVGDTMSKLLVTNMNVGQIIFLRGFATTSIVALIVWRLRAFCHPRLLLDRMLFLRICFEVLATTTYITALGLTPFANVSAIQQAIPLVATFGAALFFGEKVGWRRWMAILVGLIGVLIILRPGSDGLAAGALFAISGMLFTASRDLATRAVDRAIPSSMITLCTSAFVTIAGGVLVGPLGGWTPITSDSWIFLGIGAVAAMIGYQAAILGMRTGEVSFVSPMRYLSLIFSATAGFFVFGEYPDYGTLLGAAIVIGAGIYTFYREARRGRMSAVPPPVGPRITR
jgi:drug/metabolite transporter (DMT)-like permease